MAEELYDRILEDAFEASEQGRELTLADLLRRHPGHEATARRALEAAARYLRARDELAHRRPLVIDALQPGQRLGDFEIEAPLARGGMGCVYVARQLSLGQRRVALKVLPPEAASAIGTARFEREATTLASLHHPSLAEVYGVGSAGGTPYFAMRLIEGRTLRDVLEARATARTAREPEEQHARRALVARIAEVADALSLLHESGLVHRDVKPSNVVLQGAELTTSRAVLVDFGLARPIDSRTLTLSSESPATPSYAPPEQILGHEVDARADVFSLGVTLHDLLTARRPNERMQASAGLEPLRALVPGADADLEAIVARAVDPDPRWRYANATELRDDLQAWLEGDAVSARRTPWGQRARRWIARRPRQIARGTLAAVAVIALAFLLASPYAAWRDARLARNAYEQGDVRELQRLSHGLPAWFPMSDPHVASALERLRGSPAGDPLIRLRDALTRNDLRRALLIAAEEVGRDETPSEPLFERFLLTAPALEAAGSDQGATILQLWCVLLARLFYERPVEAAERGAWARPFVKAIRSAWRRPDLTPTARHYLATALGQCGEPSDGLDPMMRWTVEEGRSPEDVRVGLRASQRIVQRARASGRAHEVPGEALWACFESRVHDWGAPIGAMTFADDKSMCAWVRTLLIADRAAGRVSPTADLWLTIRPRPAIASDAGRQLGPWVECLALAGDEELLAFCGQDPLPWRGVMRIGESDLGRATTFLERREVAERIARAARANLTAAAWEEFESESVEALEELAGRVAEEQLDAETRLGAERDGLSIVELACSLPPLPYPSRISQVLLGLLRSPEERLHLRLLGRTRVASWGFALPLVDARGLAGVPRAVAAEYQWEGHGFLKLYAMGHSRLELPFEVDSGAPRGSWVAHCGLQTNARDYFPMQGESRVEILLNGEHLQTTTVSTVDSTQLSVEFSSRRLRLGVNRLELRLSEDSTTPLRVLAVDLVSTEE